MMLPSTTTTTTSAEKIHPGHFVWIMSGDTSDIDGYVIISLLPKIIAGFARMGITLVVAIVVPERIACANLASTDAMEHDVELGKEIVRRCGDIMAYLAGGSKNIHLVRGIMNKHNIFTAKMQFSELEHFVRALEKVFEERNQTLPKVHESVWLSIEGLAALIKDEDTFAVMLDGNGSLGYLVRLSEILGEDGMCTLGAKMKASGVPMPIMAGVLGEVPTKTMVMEGRNPRATMNALYAPQDMKLLIKLAIKYSAPLLFVTNNACVSTVKFDSIDKVLEYLSIDPVDAKVDKTGKVTTAEVISVLANGWYTWLKDTVCNGKAHFVLYDVLCFWMTIGFMENHFKPKSESESGLLKYEERNLYSGVVPNLEEILRSGTPLERNKALGNIAMHVLVTPGEEAMPTVVANTVGTERVDGALVYCACAQDATAIKAWLAKMAKMA